MVKYRQRNFGVLAALVSLSLVLSTGPSAAQNSGQFGYQDPNAFGGAPDNVYGGVANSDSYGSSGPRYQQVQQQSAPDPYRPNDAYQPNDGQSAPRYYDNRAGSPAGRYDDRQRNDAYVPPGQPQGTLDGGRATSYAAPPPRYVQPYRPPQDGNDPRGYGSSDRYDPNYGREDRRYNGQYDDRSAAMPDADRGTYSENEVIDAGHRFFGSLSNGLAKAVQWAFKNSGRPNGYILGEDAGGAFVAGLRYGEGKLYTKNHGVQRVFWQGPSIGYDFGGDGNRTMTLVYNLRSPNDVFRRFGGVQGAAYLVGGVSVQLLTAGDMTLAPIRTGVGLRLGANIGYLKYTRRPTWNPF